jgi:hypothetical protein
LIMPARGINRTLIWSGASRVPLTRTIVGTELPRVRVLRRRFELRHEIRFFPELHARLTGIDQS